MDLLKVEYVEECCVTPLADVFDGTVERRRGLGITALRYLVFDLQDDFAEQATSPSCFPGEYPVALFG
ncbi:hypothetical protein BLL42_04970 [Pseudomonas frederiksbergensis]|uniref:Uncharacterized protein n=1 Tax=Pseudomonas frederiksbergensis TaxID=104087 RepID=A0A1J0EH09_9PSED|nr:hypothetical protein BLL42_04970 [Pseudomonas frederiksbergensis]